MTDMTLKIEGMHCASCVGRVERTLGGLDYVSDARVNLAAEEARLSLADVHDASRAVAALAEAGYPVVTDRIDLSIEGMHCASCVGTVERALTALPGVLSAKVNLAAESASVTVAAGTVLPSKLAETVTDTGYLAKVSSGDTVDFAARKEAETRQLARLTLVAALLTLPVFVAEMGGHAIPAFRDWQMQTFGQMPLRIAEFLLTTLVLVGPGQRFYRTGLPVLLKGAPDMNTLVAVGTLAAWGYSTVATFAPGLFPAGAAMVYFESAAVIVTLILAGRWMEARAKGRTGAAIRALMKLRPTTAQVERDGTVQEVETDDVVVGDILLARPGDAIAVDGEVVSGESRVDESMVTGEPAPVAKAAGAELTAGTINTTGALRYRATKVGADTMLAQIVRMVEQAQGEKLPIQSLVDKVTRWFVPAVMGLSVLTLVVWLVFGPSPALANALVAAVAVLIIACPCAMGLATPTSIMVGTGRAAELGVLFRKGDALQRLQEAKVIAFDKTGTLTEGRPDVTDVLPAGGTQDGVLLALAAAAEATSEHPIASAITRAAEARGLPLAEATAFEAIPGHGLSAQIAGSAVLIGTARLMAERGVELGDHARKGSDLAELGKTPVFVAQDGALVGLLGIEDPIKDSARAAITALKASGHVVAMVTGDTKATAKAIAARLGIEDVRAEVLPKGKVSAVEGLRADHGDVAFVGDGINDAPALAAADVGLAMGTGTDVAIGSADVVLVSGDVGSVPAAIAYSTKTMRNIRQNLGWAFGYNVVLIPVAAGLLYPAFGLMLSPMLAALAMALSSVFVLTNALRLRFMEAHA